MRPLGYQARVPGAMAPLQGRGEVCSARAPFAAAVGRQGTRASPGYAAGAACDQRLQCMLVLLVVLLLSLGQCLARWGNVWHVGAMSGRWVQCILQRLHLTIPLVGMAPDFRFSPLRGIRGIARERVVRRRGRENARPIFLSVIV